MDDQKLEDAARELLRTAPQSVATAWLFGSVARRESHAQSDLDVGILLAAGSEDAVDTAFELEAALERQLAVPVQVVVLATASLDLVYRVLRDGRLLLDRDSRRRHEFEIRAMSLYYDFRTTMEPILYPKRAERASP